MMCVERALLWILAASSILASPKARAEVSAPEVLSRDFASARELMLKGEAKSAAALYESLIERGAVHPDVYFNLGNAYARSQQWIRAVVAYERALRLDPAATDVKANLRAVRTILDPNYAATTDAPDHNLVDVIEPWLAPISPRAGAIALVTAHAFLVLALFLYRMGRRLPGAGLGAVALVATLSCGLVTAGHYLIAHDPRAVMLQATPLRKGPDSRFEKTTEIPAGSRVRILNTDGAWNELQNGDGTVGWAPAKSIEPI